MNVTVYNANTGQTESFQANSIEEVLARVLGPEIEAAEAEFLGGGAYCPDGQCKVSPPPRAFENEFRPSRPFVSTPFFQPSENGHAYPGDELRSSRRDEVREQMNFVARDFYPLLFEESRKYATNLLSTTPHLQPKIVNSVVGSVMLKLGLLSIHKAFDMPVDPEQLTYEVVQVLRKHRPAGSKGFPNGVL